MKKLILYLIILTLIVCNIPTLTFASKPGTDFIRVGLYYGASAQTTCTLSSDSGFIVGTETDRTFKEDYTLNETSLTITISNDGIAKFGDKTFDTNNSRLTFFPAGDNRISTFGNTYRGGIQIINAGNSKMTVVNFIDVDEYVYGVVGMEMSPSWHIEALKAQAVCARNYALSTLNKHSSYGFDVCTSTDCQVYSAGKAETESTIRAGKETEGKYLMYNGSLVNTLFFSCSGGHTANPKYVWGGEFPYLQAVKDPYESPDDASRYNWSFTYTTNEIKQRLESTGINIGDIVSISAKADEESGYVYELNITGTDGTHTYTKEKTRTWMGWDKLYSQRYVVTPVSDENSDLKAVSSKGKSTVANSVVISSDGKKASFGYPLTVKSSKGNSKISKTITAFRFDGHGWGHGVGMSQYGAKAMAEKGFTYQQILEFYYTGAHIE